MILKDKDHGSKTLEALGKGNRFKWGLQNNEQGFSKDEEDRELKKRRKDTNSRK